MISNNKYKDADILTEMCMSALPFSCTENDEICKIHNNNNIVIKNIIDNFKTANINNLTNEDFVIIGSSCASYMDYITLKNVRDVDIHLLDESKRNKKVLTRKIDFLPYILLPSDYKDRLVKKDGYYFLSKEDFLISACAAGLLKQKSRDILYSAIMLSELNMSVGELHDVMKEIIPKMEKCIKLPEVNEKLLSCLDDIEKYFTDEKINLLKEESLKLL